MVNKPLLRPYLWAGRLTSHNCSLYAWTNLYVSPEKLLGKCQTDFPSYLEVSYPCAIWATSLNDKVKLPISHKQCNKETWSTANIPRDSDEEKAFLVMLALCGHNIDVTPKSESKIHTPPCLTNKCSSLCKQNALCCTRRYLYSSYNHQRLMSTRFLISNEVMPFASLNKGPHPPNWIYR